jgi:hypothetical protein
MRPYAWCEKTIGFLKFSNNCFSRFAVPWYCGIYDVERIEVKNNYDGFEIELEGQIFNMTQAAQTYAHKEKSGVVILKSTSK